VCRPYVARSSARQKKRRVEAAGQLADVIERQILPRLMLLASEPPAKHKAAQPKPATISAGDIEELARIAVNHDVDVACSFVSALHARGLAVDALLLDLLAPAARLIGQQWEEDRVSFVDVTVALSRMQQIVRGLRPDVPGRAREDGQGGGRRVLLLPTPGEQHTFGMLIVCDMLRSAGFDVSGGHELPAGERQKLISSQPFVMIGFSLSAERLLPGLEKAIQTVRRSPVNKHACVVVGGRVFLDTPAAVARVGADGVARDGRHAVEIAEALPVARA
jgi:methanogenic corrinoid protein MtbC1